MKELMKYTSMMMALMLTMATVSSCNDDDDDDMDPAPTVKTYTQEDQMGRPGINTVFTYGNTTNKNAFNVTIPSEMEMAFQADFEATLLAVNPNYTTNALGLDATTFTTVLSQDVLQLDTDQPSNFGALNGRTLSNDVIDVELTLILGGPSGDPVGDNVNGNDKTFMTNFPYLAAPHL